MDTFIWGSVLSFVHVIKSLFIEFQVPWLSAAAGVGELICENIFSSHHCHLCNRWNGKLIPHQSLHEHKLTFSIILNVITCSSPTKKLHISPRWFGPGLICDQCDITIRHYPFLFHCYYSKWGYYLKSRALVSACVWVGLIALHSHLKVLQSRITTLTLSHEQPNQFYR